MMNYNHPDKVRSSRSYPSVGANVKESKHAQSDAVFLSKMSIAYKED
jgi:four helix bundle protein